MEKVDWLKAKLQTLIAVVREPDLFPSTPTVLMDTVWNNSLVYGNYYYRPLPANVDVLALDACFQHKSPA